MAGPEVETPKASLKRLETTGKIPGVLTLVWTRFLIFIERFVPAILPALAVCAIFTIFALYNMATLLPWLVHYGVLAALAGGFVFVLVRDLKDLELPSRREAQQRLEADGNVAHAALQSLDDRPFEGEGKNPLWRLHQLRMQREARKAKLGPVRATADIRDPLHLRYAATLLIALGLVLAGKNTPAYFARALAPHAQSGVPVMVDIWIDPPDYTGKPPLVLAQGRAEGLLRQKQAVAAETLTVPAGAVVNMRVTGTPKYGPGKARLRQITQPINSGVERRTIDLAREGQTISGQVPLIENNVLELTISGEKISWPIAVLTDRPPTVNFSQKPAATEDNKLQFTVAIADDYGIAKGIALIKLVPGQQRPLDSPVLDREISAETVELIVNHLTGARGPRLVELDLTDHPWAGLQVQLRIKVIDGTGQSAETLTETVTLPERSFYNPLAKSVIDERRNLAVAPKSWPRTARALDALSLAPEEFYDQPKDYLLVRAAYWSVFNNKGTDTSEVVQEFWPLALQLEDQALELARRALEAAQLALREALERGASAEEIARLVENLRKAMDAYIAALAASGQSMAEQSGSGSEVGENDLQKMLDDINALSEAGANNAARQLLSELENMLRNMQIAEGKSGKAGSSGGSGSAGQSGAPGGAGGQGGSGGKGGGQMDAAGELISRQRDLADETFGSARSGGGAGRSASTLGQEQQGLADDVEAMLDALGQSGAGQDETLNKLGTEAREAYRDALRKMRDAQETLESGNLGAATTAQSEAIQSLRDGADALAQAQLAKQQGNGGEGAGDNKQNGQAQAGNGANPDQVDPLGRPYGAAPGQDIGIPDFSNPEKARELIQELRRRLSEPGRSKAEIEYLERLLERF